LLPTSETRVPPMMPASTTLASSQPRWGDQKAPITAAPKTSQNPFRHLVGRGAPCVSASSKAPAGHAAVGGSRPAFIGHRNYPFVVVRRYRVQARPEDGGDEQGFGAKQQQGANPARSEAVSDISRRLYPRVPPSLGKRRWWRRTNVWRKGTSPARGRKRQRRGDGGAVPFGALAKLANG